MSVCLTRLALLTRYDKLPSLLTPSLGYLWLINWTKKGPCRPSRGTLQCSSSGPSSKRRTKEGEGEGRTSVSAPWLEIVFTKGFKVCFLKKQPPMAAQVNCSRDELLSPSLCCCLASFREAWAWSWVRLPPCLLWAWLESQHGTWDHSRIWTQCQLVHMLSVGL